MLARIRIANCISALNVFLFVLVWQMSYLADTTSGQVFGGLGRGQDALGINARISEQRVLRQTEVMRLEQLIEGIGKRVTRMERQLLANSRFPAITVPEAEAALVLAETRLKETEKNQGEKSEIQIATERLAVAQAKGQLQIAIAAQAENLILLDLDRIHAESEYVAQSNELIFLERSVAKGYTSGDRLPQRRLEVELAKKRLDLAKLRLNTQKRLAGEPIEGEVIGEVDETSSISE